jgi:hypothetical protein
MASAEGNFLKSFSLLNSAPFCLLKKHLRTTFGCCPLANDKSIYSQSGQFICNVLFFKVSFDDVN